MNPARWRLFRPAILLPMLLVAWLVGCTTVSSQVTSQVPQGGPDLKDRMTASDEPDAVKRGQARLELATAYFGRGQMTTALDQVKLSIQADPTSSAAFDLRGLIYANLGETALAEESFRHALQLKSQDADVMQNLGWFLCQQRRYAEAETLFRQALAVPTYRNVPRTLLAEGVCQARAGQLAESAGTLNRAYELDPNNPSTAFNLAEVLYRHGEYERARFFIRRVNNMPNVSSAQTLWLATRIEHRLADNRGVQEFGTELRNRFPESREASLFQRGAFDE